VGVTGIGDINRFILQFKQRLNGIITQIWCADIINASRCSTYVHFKTLLNPENYKLNVEIGRHYGIDKENRICSAI